MPLRLLPLLLLVACEGFTATSSLCTYDDNPGVCTFTDVTADAQVAFTFQADDGSVTESSTLVIGDEGAAPDQACIDELGIAVDDVVRCNRKSLSESEGNGTCDAVQWEYDDFDPSDCEH